MPQETTQTKSISSAFHRALFLIYLVSVLAVIPVVYSLTKEEIYAQSNKELKLMVDVVRSTRAIVRERTRPHFMPKGEFFPPVAIITGSSISLRMRMKSYEL